ncbi:unnamed protein product [Rangifer tarandus platyrhynchus]|uniref:G-protein coupled receptors family 1 profile domain-containing protein n=2 Tax=Rangifer tarandus platyrhynchus TaxID=3082113 RepID=A0ABN8ZYA0_RANTA|nr:unnamed protein product [Rangifer tarandus platyrhynchus]CAI9711157.1 unnamed protein product [Rangifer tarandus platyrhynchus]
MLAPSRAVMNQTLVTEFFILGFSETPGLRTLLFFGFLLLYTVALSGNLLTVVVISSSPALHTPMYFFLVNLAVVDILCTSTILPELLVAMVASETISYGGCMAPLFCFTWSTGAELLLFSAMAFGLINTSVNTGLLLRLPFCRSNVVEHFVCEVPPLLKLSCAPTQLNEAMALTADIFLAVGNFSAITLSCCCVIASILRMRSAVGERRAFSTCSSRLLVVTLYYPTIIYT